MKKLSISESNITSRILYAYKRSQLTELNISQMAGVHVQSYKDLVNEIAELSYKNSDFMLFFRGQNKDYTNKAGSSSLYPSIYRGDYIKKEEISRRFSILTYAEKELINEIKKINMLGSDDLIRKKYISWSILQHYEVCGTPFLDITHSIRVACSFALRHNLNEYGVIYVLALPYVTHRISTNSEHDTVNVRLLSISPPDALRPYYQEGYLVGTEFARDDYENKQELDLNTRLIAKYYIPSKSSFWGNDSGLIDDELLFPRQDIFLEICNIVKNSLSKYSLHGKSQSYFENYIKLWNLLENNIYIKDLSTSLYQSMKLLYKNEIISLAQYEDYRVLSIFRNRLVHSIVEISKEDLFVNLMRLDKLISGLKEQQLLR